MRKFVSDSDYNFGGLLAGTISVNLKTAIIHAKSQRSQRNSNTYEGRYSAGREKLDRDISDKAALN
jgi:hypothetical protein